MIKTFIIEKGQKPTNEQLQEVIEASKQPIVFDDDSPELSSAMYKAFKSSVIQRNRKKNAKNINIVDRDRVENRWKNRYIIFKDISESLYILIK